MDRQKVLELAKAVGLIGNEWCETKRGSVRDTINLTDQAMKIVIFYDALQLKWKRGIPSKPGYYWVRYPTQEDPGPYIELVRNYCGNIAIGNSDLKGWIRFLFEEAWWAGPIIPPPN